MCNRCFKFPALDGFKVCQICRDKRAEYYRNNKEMLDKIGKRARDKTATRLRSQAYAAYGGKCVCCGINDVNYLQYDHINGGGAKHRQEIGWGINFLKWLEKNNYPNILQLLCANCHHMKTNKKTCPEIHPWSVQK